MLKSQHPPRIRKAVKDFAKNLYSVKIRDIHKIEKKNSITITVFGDENKEKHQIYVSKKCFDEKYVNLLLIGKVEKSHYVLIKDFNTFMYNRTSMINHYIVKESIFVVHYRRNFKASY